MISTSCKKRKRTKFVQKDYFGNLYCYKCKCYKSINNFDNSPQESDIFYREGKDKRCKQCKILQYKKRKEQNRGKKDLNRVLLERWHGVKERSAKKGYSIDFEWEFLKNLWEIQQGLCAISKIPMTFEVDNGRVYTNLSVDRIFPSLPYSKNNIQLVCMAVNQMKSDMDMQELLYFCNQIIINNENKNN